MAIVWISMSHLVWLRSGKPVFCLSIWKHDAVNLKKYTWMEPVLVDFLVVLFFLFEIYECWRIICVHNMIKALIPLGTANFMIE